MAEVWNIPQKDQIVVSGFNYIEEIKKGAGKFVGKTTYTYQNDELRKIEIPSPTYQYRDMREPNIISVPIDLLDVPKEYVYYDKRMIAVYFPYWISAMKITNLPAEINRVFDFDHFLQLLVFPDEKKALVLAFRRDKSERNVTLIDLAGKKILNDSIRINLKTKAKILSLSLDNNQFYLYEDNPNKEDKISIYDIDTFKLIKEIKFGNLNLGLPKKTVLSKNGRYLTTIFEEYENSSRKPPPGYLLVIDTKTKKASLIKIEEGWPIDIITD